MKNLLNIFAGFIAPIFGIYFSFLGFLRSNSTNNKLGIYISLTVIMLSITWFILRLFLDLKSRKRKKNKEVN